jgi:hypothetical protein
MGDTVQMFMITYPWSPTKQNPDEKTTWGERSGRLQARFAENTRKWPAI